MEERSSHLTVVIGASSVAEDLRRMLVQRRVAHAGVVSHVRGLRRSLCSGQTDLMIICIALDQPTLKRHGDSVRQLLRDCRCFPQAVRSVGLLTEIGLTPDVASMGCDVYAQDSTAAATAVRLLARKWRSRAERTRRPNSRREPVVADRLAPDAWVWGARPVPFEFSRLFSSSSRKVGVVGGRNRFRASRAKHGRGTSRNPEPPPAFD